MGNINYNQDPGFSRQLLEGALRIISPGHNDARQDITNLVENEADYVVNEFNFDPCTDPEVARKITLIQELCQEVQLVSDEGQRFNGLWTNRPRFGEPQKPVCIVAIGFMGSVSTRDKKLRLYWLSRELPDHQFVCFEQPSHGSSDLYTPEQKNALLSGDMSTTGEAQFTAYRNFRRQHVEPFGKIPHEIVKGDSLGARQSLEIVHAACQVGELAIRGIIGMDTPNLVPGRRFSAHGRYAYDVLRSQYYRQEWIEPYVASFDRACGQYGTTIPSVGRFDQNDKNMAVRNVFNSPLEKANGIRTIEQLVTRYGIYIVDVVNQLSLVGNAPQADVLQREMLKKSGKTFELAVNTNQFHEGLGHLSVARLVAQLAQQYVDGMALGYKPLTHKYSISMEQVQRGINVVHMARLADLSATS